MKEITTALGGLAEFGQVTPASLDELASQSADLGSRLIAAAYGYFKGDITREECESTMTGESLHTGKKGKTLKDVRYAASISGISR